MSKGSVRRKGQNFEDNFDKIFGKDKKVERGSFIQVDGEIVSRETFHKTMEVNAPEVMKSFKPFKSPINGELITCREQLRKHHIMHETTDSRDYSNGYIENRARSRISNEKKAMHESRVNDLSQAIDKLRRG